MSCKRFRACIKGQSSPMSLSNFVLNLAEDLTAPLSSFEARRQQFASDFQEMPPSSSARCWRRNLGFRQRRWTARCSSEWASTTWTPTAPSTTPPRRSNPHPPASQAPRRLARVGPPRRAQTVRHRKLKHATARALAIGARLAPEKSIRHEPPKKINRSPTQAACFPQVAVM